MPGNKSGPISPLFERRDEDAVGATDHEIAGRFLDQLREGLVSFESSDPADLPNRVVGTVFGRECLRILLNETGKLQIEIQTGATHAP